jgi:hypothetical protein
LEGILRTWRTGSAQPVDEFLETASDDELFGLIDGVLLDDGSGPIGRADQDSWNSSADQ